MTRFTLNILVLVASLSCCHDRGLAQQRFNFISSPSGENLVFATLELNTSPADEISDFGRLTFTSEGDSEYGFGVGPYQGTFDESNFGDGRTVNVVDNELIAIGGSGPDLGVFIEDIDPPGSSLNPNPVAPSLIIRIRSPSGISGISYFDSGSGADVLLVGNFIAVPEPNSVCFVLLSSFLIGLKRRR